jgi:LysR family hydrogen peroxide-inducible transcriptional activator
LKHKSVAREDLSLKDAWLLAEGHCLRDQMMTLCRRRGEGRIYPNVSFEAGTLEMLRQLIGRSQGWTLMPDLLMRTLPKSEIQNCARPLRAPGFYREVSLVHPRTFWKMDLLNTLKSVIESATQDMPRQVSERQIVEVNNAG